MKKQAGQSSRRSVDSISHLPEDVLNLVLVRLPIRDAVRTGILSKKWRHKWVSIPDIVFDKDCLMKDKSITEHADVVDQVLLNHVGPIIKFSCASYVPSCSHIDRWIAFLSRNGIKKIIIAMKLLEGHYDVPSNIFNCQDLYHLELIFCRLKVPPTFKGFQNLLVLTLDVVYISKDDIARLISKCPLLERLKLLIDFFDRFHIHAQNLRYLEVSGCFREFSLGNSPLLTNVSIEFNMPPTNLETDNTCSLTKFIGCSFGIERLALNNSVIQFFCLAGVPEKFFVTLEHLKYLEVEIDLNSTEILPILCILRSSPNLEELKIQYGVDSVQCRINLLEEGARFWGELTRFDCLLNHLRAVEIIGLGMLLDLEFIKCMLSNALILEKMIIYTNEFVEAEAVLRILTELLQFQRASAQARIIYLGHYKPSC